MKKIIIYCVLCALGVFNASAQTDRPTSIYKSIIRGFEYEVNAGINIGGAAPLPLPSEIREINSYNPNLNLSLGGIITKWLDKDKSRWGIAVGLRFEIRGMSTKANVKNYGMEIINEGVKMKGRWTGNVNTNYQAQQLTIPITAVYRINKRWKVSAGPYLAVVFGKSFDGHVSDGYLREGNPTGTKWSFSDGKIATYNFDDELRRFQWGLQAGASWRAFKRLAVNANIVWGCNDIFTDSFKTITFNMYPIYLNFGFGYLF